MEVVTLPGIPELNISGFEVRLTTPAVGNAEVEITVLYIYLPTKTSFITHDSQLPHHATTRTDWHTSITAREIKGATSIFFGGLLGERWERKLKWEGAKQRGKGRNKRVGGQIKQVRGESNLPSDGRILYISEGRIKQVGGESNKWRDRRDWG